MKTKTVRIVERTRIIPNILKVEVEWNCPKCGIEMNDDVAPYSFHEDGDNYVTDVWTSPCGHVAKYDELKIVSMVRTCVKRHRHDRITQ